MSPPYHPPPPPSPRPLDAPDIRTALNLIPLLPSNSSSPYSKLHLLPIPKSRRFPQIPLSISMSSPNSNPNSSRHPFPTPQSLSNWLQSRLPSSSLASWGVKPGTKNVHNLWLELVEGETFLADSSPPVRTVNVVAVRIIRHGLVLVESHQEMSDGSRRDRLRPLSEKMRPGELPEAAVFRAVREELGSVLAGEVDVKIVEGSYVERVEERHSMSYPGLPARYVLHTMDAVVGGLPEGEFSTEEREEYGDCDGREEAKSMAVCVRRHFWKWVPLDFVNS